MSNRPLQHFVDMMDELRAVQADGGWTFSELAVFVRLQRVEKEMAGAIAHMGDVVDGEVLPAPLMVTHETFD